MMRHLFRARAAATRPPPRAPEGSRVYAIGDIHGCAGLLRRLHEAVRADAESAVGLRKVVVYLGDYIDRGLESRQVIDMLTREPLEGFERVYLMGNHDLWMLEFLDDPAAGPGWLFNGGNATLLSYGVGQGEALGAPARLAALQAQLRAALPAAHRDFLAALRPMHVEGDYLFVHAGVRPGVPLDAQSNDDLFWIRDPFLDSDADFGKVVVHGHTIAEAPEILPNRIGIDTGAFATGRLTCLVLEGTQQRFLQT